MAVEPLAKRLGATKGSFYWHFDNRDALIAATARAHGATLLATRNTKDFEGCGVALVNPWGAP